ncbi:hypothetical protein G3I19_06175 [Streptomyces sp. SID10853]|uniref:hypothetical protein n=1 Tax=Streptomyces sp. SID10853 TaxID=2706028 RepID=UPI0013C2878C|nr:hypothetical protein [Streptomyces sp. SID10853]NDZ78117.1 hypothetical protein [Streptomyces sp. SID10853]
MTAPDHAGRRPPVAPSGAAPRGVIDERWLSCVGRLEEPDEAPSRRRALLCHRCDTRPAWGG